MISEKDIEHVKILDEYIPYAISLEEDKNIEKFIKGNKQYKALIYNKD